MEVEKQNKEDEIMNDLMEEKRNLLKRRDSLDAERTLINKKISILDKQMKSHQGKDIAKNIREFKKLANMKDLRTKKDFSGPNGRISLKKGVNKIHAL